MERFPHNEEPPYAKERVHLSVALLSGTLLYLRQICNLYPQHVRDRPYNPLERG